MKREKLNFICYESLILCLLAVNKQDEAVKVFEVMRSDPKIDPHVLNRFSETLQTFLTNFEKSAYINWIHHYEEEMIDAIIAQEKQFRTRNQLRDDPTSPTATETAMMEQEQELQRTMEGVQIWK